MKHLVEFESIYKEEVTVEDEATPLADHMNSNQGIEPVLRSDMMRRRIRVKGNPLVDPHSDFLIGGKP